LIFRKREDERRTVILLCQAKEQAEFACSPLGFIILRQYKNIGAVISEY